MEVRAETGQLSRVGRGPPLRGPCPPLLYTLFDESVPDASAIYDVVVQVQSIRQLRKHAQPLHCHP